MNKVIVYYDDCRDKCRFFQEHHCCHMCCYSFNVAPLHKMFLHRLRHSIESEKEYFMRFEQK